MTYRPFLAEKVLWAVAGGVMFYGMFIPDFGQGVSKTLQMSLENTHLKHFARMLCACMHFFCYLCCII
ncbi:MAG: hypothetical protein IJ160_03130 [Muribaculaceae bacterium]|nr:hypothetical protein [Muribaculaceae bacterium]